MFRILKYVWKHKASLIIATLAMMLIIGVDLCSPYLQKIFLDEGIINNKSSIIVPILAILVGISVIKAVFGYVKEYLYDAVSSYVQEDLKNDLFKHIQSLEYKYFDNMNTGELMSRINEDIENVWQTLGFGLRMFVENIFYFTFSAIIIFVLDWRLASLQ